MPVIWNRDESGKKNPHLNGPFRQGVSYPCHGVYMGATGRRDTAPRWSSQTGSGFPWACFRHIPCRILRAGIFLPIPRMAWRHAALRLAADFHVIVTWGHLPSCRNCPGGNGLPTLTVSIPPRTCPSVPRCFSLPCRPAAVCQWPVTCAGNRRVQPAASRVPPRWSGCADGRTDGYHRWTACR